MNKMHLTARNVVLLAPATAVAALVLAACSGGSDSGTPTDDSTPAGTATVTSTTTVGSGAPSGDGTPNPTGGTPSATGGTPSATGGTSAPTGGGGGGATPAACQESQLRASIDPRPVLGSADKGHFAVIVDFTNASSTACTISGYPGAALLDSAGKQVKQATRTVRGYKLGLPSGQNSLPRVTLPPSAVASAGVEGVNQQEQGAAQAGCQDVYPKILITPPNTRTPVPFDVRWPRCYSLEVHPTNLEQHPPN